MLGMGGASFVWITWMLCLVYGGSCSDICDTPACKNMSERILSNMDPSVKPCDDFYRFACGKFVDTAEIADYEMRNSSVMQHKDRLEHQLNTILNEKPNPGDPLPFRNLKNLFSLCMYERKIDARGIDHAVSRLRQAGGWPVLGDWEEENWNFLDTEIKLRNLSIGGDDLFRLSVAINLLNNSRRVLLVSKPDRDFSRGHFPREFLIKGPDDPAVQAYYSYMVDIAVLYGAERKTATEQLKESLLFEIEMAKLNSTIPRVYNLRLLKSGNRWVDWDRLLRSTMPEDVRLKENEDIVISGIDYLDDLRRLVRKYPKQVIANYMMWHAARRMAEVLTDAMRNRTQEFRGALTGTTARAPRWRECIQATQRLEIALSSLYVMKHFNKTSKKEVADVIERIRQEMSRNIQEADWLDEESRSQALEKVAHIQAHIGYPDELLNITNIESHYQGLVLDDDHYFDAWIKLTQWKHNYEFRRLREPVNKTDWRDHSNAAVVNAFYNVVENSIKMPAGNLQPPIFDTRLPKYVNYARLGFEVAHEVSHGFSVDGSNFDYKGDLEDLFSYDSEEIFNEKTKCIIDQYSNFVDSTTQLNLNGEFAQDENLADNEAIKLAYRAYKELNLDEPLLPGLQNYTQEQLFMLNMANQWCARYRPKALKSLIITNLHSPPEFRVNGPLKNFQDFSNIFGCSRKDPMNPAKKCEVW